MKSAVILLFLIILQACTRNSQETGRLQARVDSLQQQLKSAYKPGFGEFMSAIQVHHAKLWFAGQAENWELANFEVHEIMESLENIEKYNADRPESAELGMINPAMDSVHQAITQKSATGFVRAFVMLTNSCNQCHRATHHQFNVIKIPETRPFSNQEYRGN